jgi:hypothetical protein
MLTEKRSLKILIASSSLVSFKLPIRSFSRNFSARLASARENLLMSVLALVSFSRTIANRNEKTSNGNEEPHFEPSGVELKIFPYDAHSTRSYALSTMI